MGDGLGRRKSPAEAFFTAPIHNFGERWPASHDNATPLLFPRPLRPESEVSKHLGRIRPDPRTSSGSHEPAETRLNATKF